MKQGFQPCIMYYSRLSLPQRPDPGPKPATYRMPPPRLAAIKRAIVIPLRFSPSNSSTTKNQPHERAIRVRPFSRRPFDESRSSRPQRIAHLDLISSIIIITYIVVLHFVFPHFFLSKRALSVLFLVFFFFRPLSVCLRVSLSLGRCWSHTLPLCSSSQPRHHQTTWAHQTQR